LGFTLPPVALPALRWSVRLLFSSFTGAAKNNVLRMLPPLCISKDEIDIFIQQFKKLTSK
jgi:4-aminobutyrate aminotransferase-like enzyme